jgi:hypothetical protein
MNIASLLLSANFLSTMTLVLRSQQSQKHHWLPPWPAECQRGHQLASPPSYSTKEKGAHGLGVERCRRSESGDKQQPPCGQKGGTPTRNVPKRLHLADSRAGVHLQPLSSKKPGKATFTSIVKLLRVNMLIRLITGPG